MWLPDIMGLTNIPSSPNCTVRQVIRYSLLITICDLVKCNYANYRVMGLKNNVVQILAGLIIFKGNSNPGRVGGIIENRKVLI